MRVLVDKLEDPYETLAITNYKVVGPRVQAESCQFQLPSASVALLSLEAEGLVEALRDIDVREGPSIAVVAPQMDGKIV